MIKGFSWLSALLPAGALDPGSAKRDSSMTYNLQASNQEFSEIGAATAELSRVEPIAYNCPFPWGMGVLLCLKRLFTVIWTTYQTCVGSPEATARRLSGRHSKHS
jgi:hypothetical protein